MPPRERDATRGSMRSRIRPLILSCAGSTASLISPSAHITRASVPISTLPSGLGIVKFVLAGPVVAAINRRPAVLVAERKEAEEDDREYIAIVVGRLDGPSQVHRRLPKLLD